MRLVMLDTETTGLSPAGGDRIVEIGAVEVVHRRVTERHFHHYLNPDRPIPADVVRIHGIDDEKVKDAPRFAEIGASFLDFIRDATLVIHNAPFDLGFLMHELDLAGLPGIEDVPVIDTLAWARKLHPNQRNNLDALCDRYGIARGHRTLHGALLDSELLAEVYLAMSGGRQFSLTLDAPVQPAGRLARAPRRASQRDERAETAAIMRRPPPPLPEEDRRAHEALMARIQDESGGNAIWATA
ncbi:MAG: DNA polymerase III subunit epsilon [Mariprofundaceae bacterium]